MVKGGTKDSPVVFVDGACLGNPGAGAAAWIVAFSDWVEEGVEAEPLTTNNRMELLALLRALEILEKRKFEGEARLHSDSKYVLEGAQKWIRAWTARNWKTAEGADVKNQDLWKKVAEKDLRQIRFIHVPGHRGIPGNERCDEIANATASDQNIELYSGPRSEYSVSLEVPELGSSKNPYYLSLVDGKLFRDTSWPNCEARVRGRKSARYQKCHNELEEATILKKWGYSPKV